MYRVCLGSKASSSACLFFGVELWQPNTPHNVAGTPPAGPDSPMKVFFIAVSVSTWPEEQVLQTERKKEKIVYFSYRNCAWNEKVEKKLPEREIVPAIIESLVRNGKREEIIEKKFAHVRNEFAWKKNVLSEKVIL